MSVVFFVGCFVCCLRLLLFWCEKLICLFVLMLGLATTRAVLVGRDWH